MTFEPPPLALYAHFPWCVQKCPYCDFNSHKAPGQLPEHHYVDALRQDLELDLHAFAPTPLVSIFMGGGTPSLFSPDAIARLLEGIKKILPVAADMEVTLEANPGTIEHGQFAGYRDAGINRVSLGAQSFNSEQLHKLGRIHGRDDIAKSVDELRRARIDNFNLDLMYGLPGQTIEQALQDLSQAIALAPTHLSHYQLTLEPGTAFFHLPPTLPDGDECFEMQIQCQAMLEAAGYAQYEVSAYAQPGKQSVHNRNYWEFGDYLGLGAGAHGKLSSSDGIVRTERCKQPREYLASSAASRALSPRPVNSADLPFEFMLNALRLSDGFTEKLFETRTGQAWRSVERRVQKAQARGLLERNNENWRATELGKRFLNDVISAFIDESE